MMQELATEWLPEAYMLGLGREEFTSQAILDIQRYIDRNQQFLEFSFSPDAVRKLRGLDKEALRDSGAIFDVLGVYRSRAAQYAGPYWTLIWKGMEEKVQELDRESMVKTKVERILDPNAQNCATCPPKAGTYDSWEQMLQACGGMPADGSDDCGCNCRCSVEIRT